jgi:beta-xylosidase
LLTKLPVDTLLIVETYDSMSQVVHPDVVWKRGDSSFYMALTPYPFFDSQKENPSLYISTNGVAFNYATKTNPLVPAPTKGFNCDPDIFYDLDGKLKLVYIETVTPEDQFFQMLSFNDSLHFQKTTMRTQKLMQGDDFVLSPTVVTQKDDFHLFYVQLVKDEKQPNLVKHATVKSISDFSSAVFSPINLVFPGDFEPWHVDVFQAEEGSYYMLTHGFYNGKNQWGSSLTEEYVVHLSKSVDLVNWEALGDVVDKSTIPDETTKYVYRATGLSAGNTLAIWYSYVTHENNWRLGLKKIDLSIFEKTNVK